MAGSSGASLDEMKQGVANRPEGRDLLSRTPSTNEFVIPPIELGDQLIVAATQLQRAGAGRSRPVSNAEKIALYYIALTPHLANARQLTEFAARAVERMPPGEQRIKYDHLFEPGNPDNKRFWIGAVEANASFAGSYVTLPRAGDDRSSTARRDTDTYSATERDARAPSPAADTSQPLTLPDKPSIAVLPFDNLSGDPAQEYFGDGIAGDIITALSKFRWFFVIARNSSFTHRGAAVDVKQVAHELGVRFVLEGSVRKAGSRVRINTQLIDGRSGSHVWAERYDRELADIFDLQDEMTETIVGAIEPELASAARNQARQKAPESLDAWDNYQRGLSHLWAFTKADADEAEAQLRRAMELDAAFAPAHAALALRRYYQVLLVWESPDHHDRLLEEGLHHAERAVGADDRDPFAHFALGRVQTLVKDFDNAIAELQLAIELNPNLALGFTGSRSHSRLPDSLVKRYHTPTKRSATAHAIQRCSRSRTCSASPTSHFSRTTMRSSSSCASGPSDSPRSGPISNCARTGRPRTPRRGSAT
jgi:TolB-like protein